MVGSKFHAASFSINRDAGGWMGKNAGRQSEVEDRQHELVLLKINTTLI